MQFTQLIGRKCGPSKSQWITKHSEQISNSIPEMGKNISPQAYLNKHIKYDYYKM